MNKIELLSPAGDLERLKIAFLYGADACYIGGKKFSLRANATNFSREEIKEACLYAHNIGKKVYVTVNIVFHNEDMEGLIEYLKELEEYQVDGIIVSDPVVIDMVNKNNINLDLHISTQASILNYESALYYKENNAKRIVLGRELTREEIKEIIDKTGMEVEVFVHGAMCSSYSGRCVLSNYFTGRDANRGGCAQVCRFTFDLYNENKEKVSDCPEFTMATKDLSLISYLKDMIDIGISSLKIEGRMRSNYYIATVVSTYREAIDLYYKNELTAEKIKYFEKVLSRVANRESMEQYFLGDPGVRGQYYLGRKEVSNQDFLGIVISYDDELKEVTLEQRNYFKKGDTVEFFGPNISTFTCVIGDIYNSSGEIVQVANHPQEVVRFKVDKKLYNSDIMRVKIK